MMVDVGRLSRKLFGGLQIDAIQMEARLGVDSKEKAYELLAAFLYEHNSKHRWISHTLQLFTNNHL